MASVKVLKALRSLRLLSGMKSGFYVVPTGNDVIAYSKLPKDQEGFFVLLDSDGPSTVYARHLGDNYEVKGMTADGEVKLEVIPQFGGGSEFVPGALIVVIAGDTFNCSNIYFGDR